MKLPIPIFHNGNVYTDVELEKPTTGTIADVQKIAEQGNTFQATLKFLTGCISMISGNVEITDKISLSSLIRYMPFKSAELCLIKSMLQLKEDDGIEGVYNCPRCTAQQISEKKIDEEENIIYDTRDFINQLQINYYEKLENTIYHEFEENIKIINLDNNEIIEDIFSIKLEFPTLFHCIAAQAKYERYDDLRFQFGIYIECLEEVNGQKIDNTWKNRYALRMFEKIPGTKDLTEIHNKLNGYGINRRVKKICKNCGKEWWALLNTSNFFDFDLRIL